MRSTCFSPVIETKNCYSLSSNLPDTHSSLLASTVIYSGIPYLTLLPLLLGSLSLTSAKENPESSSALTITLV